MTTVVVDTDVLFLRPQESPFRLQYGADIGGRIALISVMTVAGIERWLSGRSTDRGGAAEPPIRF
jgi:hypothetical protein